MKKFLEKQSKKSYLIGGVLLLTILGLIFYFISVSVTVSQEVNVVFNPLILVFLLLGIGFAILSLVLANIKSNFFLNDYLSILVATFLTLGMILVLADRVYSMAILLGSDLYVSDTQAYTQLYLALASLIFLFLGVVLNAVSGFFSFRKALKENETAL